MSVPTHPQQLPLFALDKRCGHCHAVKALDAFDRNKSTKDGLQGWCKSCRREHYITHADEHAAKMRAWYQVNRERVLAKCAANREARREYLRKWRDANRDRYRATMRAWRDKNLEHVRAYDRARDYYGTHREEQQSKHRAYYREHREHHLAVGRLYYNANKKRWQVSARRRRNRERCAGGYFTVQDIDRLYAEQSGLCAYCLVPLNGVYHIEHKIPVSRGGSSWPDNLCLACPPCNGSKWTKTDKEYRALIASREAGNAV